jgi:hypothetical protein
MVLGLLAAALYCSPQGRVLSIENLQLKDVSQLFDGSLESGGCVYADKFKTSKKYILQPIIFNRRSLAILKYYLGDSI